MIVPLAELYRRHRVPPNIQRHMLRTAAVASLVMDAWTEADYVWPRARIIRVLLVHDAGNIVKCDYDRLPEMLGEEQARVDYWKRIQAEVRLEHGDDAGAATLEIATACGLDEDELELLAGMDFWRNDETAAGDDFARKLAAYADQRVAPFGVVSLTERLDEARQRYANVLDAPMARPRAARMIACAHTIEAQLFDRCASGPEAIDDRSAAPVIARLARGSFETGPEPVEV